MNYALDQDQIRARGSSNNLWTSYKDAPFASLLPLHTLSRSRSRSSFLRSVIGKAQRAALSDSVRPSAYSRRMQ